MLETLQMAFIGTVVGVVIGLPLSLLSSRNISSKWIYVPIRSLLAAIRTFPSILWAILFVIGWYGCVCWNFSNRNVYCGICIKAPVRDYGGN